MKNLKYLFLAFALSLFIVPSSFALQCHEGNLGSDECWTNVVVSPLETTPIVRGTIVVYDFNGGSTDNGAYQVIASTANTDGYRVAGVAQSTIATSDSGLVMVRGQGKIRTIGNLASGDRIYVSGTAGKGVKGASTDISSVASRDKAIAFALQSATTDATNDAFIVIV